RRRAASRRGRRTGGRGRRRCRRRRLRLLVLADRVLQRLQRLPVLDEVTRLLGRLEVGQRLIDLVDGRLYRAAVRLVRCRRLRRRRRTGRLLPGGGEQLFQRAGQGGVEADVLPEVDQDVLQLRVRVRRLALDVEGLHVEHAVTDRQRQQVAVDDV